MEHDDIIDLDDVFGSPDKGSPDKNAMETTFGSNPTRNST